MLEMGENDMAGFRSFLIVLIFMATGIGIGYAIAERMIGREAAHRNLRYVLPLLLFGFAIAFLIPLLGKYGWVSFYILSALGISISMLNWFLRKQEAGALLLGIGKTAQNKLLFGVGLIGVAVAGSMTWLFFEQVLREFLQYGSLGKEASKLVFFWSCAIHAMLRGLSKLEFRENGICFMLSFIAWQKVKSCDWEQDKPNTLTIRLKPQYPLSFPWFMSMVIPAKHRDAVSYILDERLPHKSL
jgi:hypothetical protein